MASSRQPQHASQVSSLADSQDRSASTINDESSSGSSDSDSDSDLPVHRSQLFKRPPRFQKARRPDLLPFDDEAEEEPSERSGSGSASLPFASRLGPSLSERPPKTPTSQGVSTSGEMEPDQGGKSSKKPVKGQSPDASSSAASLMSEPQKVTSMAPSPLSPKHRAELARLSPRRQGSKLKKDGSEGTPSMGSSFSDIEGMQ